MAPHPLFLKPGAPLPSMQCPFGVLLDAEDKDWSNDDFLRRSCTGLLAAGCLWFVCFGERAEEIHDRIDDFIVEQEYQDVTTTYHSEESEQDVAEFFTNVALMKMKSALVLVHDRRKWERHF